MHAWCSSPGTRRPGSWRAAAVAATLVVVTALAALRPTLRAADSLPAAAEEPADAWLTGEGMAPPAEAGAVEGGARFAGVVAARSGNRMIVRWPNSGPAATEVTVMASADEPGHWGVRDWRKYPMTATRTAEGESWEVAVPIPTVGVPTVYCVRGVVEGLPRVSGLRIFRPNRAGMTEPTTPTAVDMA